MGGKKVPELNRIYERKRRDRLNDQFIELHKLLPDFDSSMIKVTKAEIINRTIQYLKDAQMKSKKMENEFENEKSKINVLQKKVTGLLQVVKELIKLFHKSNISFPSSLPVEDITSFKEELFNCKRKSITTSKDLIKKKKSCSKSSDSSESSDSNSESESANTRVETTLSPCKADSESVQISNASTSPATPQITTTTTPCTTIAATSVITQTATTTCAPHVIANVELPQVLRLNPNPLILPQGNLVAVNGLSNTLLGNAAPSSTILLNKPITVPTFILMQNTRTNLVAVGPTTTKCIENIDEKSIASTQPPVANATSTTFINKKPIPAVRLFKSRIEPKVGDVVPPSLTVLKGKKRRSKGILVKYPKRKSPSKKKKCETKSVTDEDVRPKPLENIPCKTADTKNDVIRSNANTSDSSQTSSNSQTSNSTSSNATQYSKRSDDVVAKPLSSYTCNNDHQISVFDSTDLPTSANQFMDFFDNSSTVTSRCDMNSVDNTNQFAAQSREKSHSNNDNFNNTESFQTSVTVFDGSKSESKQRKEHEKTDKNLHCDLARSSANNVAVLPKYAATNETASTRASMMETPDEGNKEKLDGRKNDASVPLSIHCDNHQSKSKSASPKGHLNLSLMDDSINISDHINKKNNYESFDEFPNDLFTSLQVPAVSGHNADSISPTAAFLQTFPLVSNCANVDLLPEHEDDNTTVTNAPNATNILQIGNMHESSSSNTYFPLLTKPNARETSTLSKSNEKSDYAPFTTSNLIEMDGSRKEKKSLCKESTGSSNYGMINFNDINLNSEQYKTADCPKEPNIPFYSTSSTASSFPSTYNLLPPVTCSYYSFASQPFHNSIAKSTVDSTTTDYNAWMPPVYNQESVVVSRDKSKKETKNTNTAPAFIKNSTGNEFSQQRADQTKNKKPKTSNTARPLVNWMTTPAPSRASSDLVPPPPLEIPVSMSKDDTMFLNSTSAFLQSQNNVNFNMPSIYPNNGCNNGNMPVGSGEYYFDGQNYIDASSNLASCKITHSAVNSSTTNHLWPSSSSKTTLPPPSLPLDTSNMIASTPLPTLVGDLALCGNTNSSTAFNNFDLHSKKYDASETKKNSSSSTTCDKNYYKNATHNSNSSSFLSVTQLVDDKTSDKQNHQQQHHHHQHQHQQLPKKNAISTDTTGTCNYKDDRNTRYKMNYGITGEKDVDNNKHCKETTSKTSTIKCTKKETTSKYHNNIPSNRYTSTTKENKKDFVRPSQQYHQHHHKPFTNDYSLQNCQQQNTTLCKETPNVLHNKNTNYSAESLIGSSNQQNTSCFQNYFPYENLNYSNCPSVTANQYGKKGTDQDQLPNMNYYTNTNYVYPNNFQSFNSNYSFSNQCYNNYSSQIVQSNDTQKKKHDHYAPSKESNWCKEGTTSYNSEPMSTEYGENQKLDARNKQQQSTSSSSSYSNKYQHNHKTGTGVDTAALNKYYQCSSSTSSSLSLMTNQTTKNGCNLNSMYSLCQSGQQFSQSHHQPSSNNYDTTKSNRNVVTANSNVHSATTLTNFNLSTIFPEINDKHCGQNRVPTIGSEKQDSKYNNKTSSLDEMNNYSYLIQPPNGNNLNSNSVYG